MIVVFILFALWWIRIRDLQKIPVGRDWLWGKLGLVLMGWAMLSKSLIQLSVFHPCVPSLYSLPVLLMGGAVFPPWGQTMVESEKWKWKSLSPDWFFVTPWTIYSSWNSPGQNIGVNSFALFQGIFPTQGWNPDLPHCRQILHHLSHHGNPRILEWVAYTFSSKSSWPRNQTGSPALQVDS